MDLPADNRTAECLHAAEVLGRVSGRLSGDGADGREPLPSHTDGPGPRAHVLPALPDALRHQAFAFRRDHTQGKNIRYTDARAHRQRRELNGVH